LAKSVVDSKNLGNGITQITFEFNLHNLGIHPLSNPNVDDKLDLCFNAPATYTFDALNSIGVPKINTLYNGKDIIRMLATNQTLAVGGVYTWSLTFRFSTNGAAHTCHSTCNYRTIASHRTNRLIGRAHTLVINNICKTGC